MSSADPHGGGRAPSVSKWTGAYCGVTLAYVCLVRSLGLEVRTEVPPYSPSTLHRPHIVLLVPQACDAAATFSFQNYTAAFYTLAC